MARTTIAQQAADVRPMTFTRTILPNGLTLVVNEDHAAPVVSVDIWYRFGSVDERNGEHGFAHACEHLSDLTDANDGRSRSDILISLGATTGNRVTTSATTGLDFTQFFATVMADRVDSLLAMEARRMARPFAVDSSRFNRVREAVRQERINRVESRVFGSATDDIRAALYPATHPYAASPLAPMADLERATVDRVVGFCRPYYSPNNAVIALSGDVNAARIRRLAQRLFGAIPRLSVPPRASTPQARVASTTHLTMRDPRARVSSLRMVWPAVGFGDVHKPALYALAGVLSGDKYGFSAFGRLPQALVRERQLATSVHVELYDAEQVGEFVIDVVARSGASLVTIEAVIDSVLDNVRDSGITDAELSRFKSLNLVRSATSLQSHAARSDTLAQGQLWAADPGAYAQQLRRSLQLTTSDVMIAARTYLFKPHMVLSLIPGASSQSGDQADVPEVGGSASHSSGESGNLAISRRQK